LHCWGSCSRYLGSFRWAFGGDSTGNCQTSSLQRESGRQSTWGKTKPVYLKATLIGQLRRSSRHRQLGDSTGNCQTSSLQRESGCQSIWGKTKPAYLKATLIGQLRRSSPRRRQLRHQWIDFLALSPVPGRSFEAALIFWCKVDAKVTLPDGDRVVIGLLREAEGEAAFIYCRAIHSIAHLGKSQAVAAGRGRPLRRGRTCVLDGIEFNTNIHEYREILRSSLRKPRVPWP
jgi:hypothetical protein